MVPQVEKLDSSDPLLSPAEVAREWGTGIQTVLDLLEEGTLKSLDDGLLALSGETNVPTVRLQCVAATLIEPS